MAHNIFSDQACDSSAAGSAVNKFLPQFAAQAVADIEKTFQEITGFLRAAERDDVTTNHGIGIKLLQSAVRTGGEVSRLLREAVHIILPQNGEIYRKNGPGATPISEAECESFRGMPGPVCSFEYSWTHGKGDRQISAPKRITLVIDGSQVDEDKPLGPGQCHHALVLSVVYDEKHGRWGPVDSFLDIDLPLTVKVENGPLGPGTAWGPRGVLRDLNSGAEIPEGPLSDQLCGEYLADLCAVAQACHSLRAGATLRKRTEPSSGRRWKFEKKGVGGFIYHELLIPGVGNSILDEERSGSGTHASPVFHMRRAHLRELASGKVTFVRHCFVGNRATGYVGKH